MIPPLINGVLPEGIHTCTIEEIEAAFGRFQRSDRRIHLTKRLRAYAQEVRNLNVASAIIVDGSYITAKAEPGDIDMILVLKDTPDDRADLNPMVYNLLSKRRVKRAYGFDVHKAVEGSDSYKEYLDLFLKVRPDDPDQSLFPGRKGLLRIEV